MQCALLQFHLLYTDVYSKENKWPTYPLFKFVSNLALTKFEKKKKRNNTLIFHLIVDFTIQCKEYLGSPRVESIELEFSWEVRGGERAYVITWKKFQSGGERSRCWVRVALRGVPGLRNRPANQPITCPYHGYLLIALGTLPKSRRANRAGPARFCQIAHYF